MSLKILIWKNVSRTVKPKPSEISFPMFFLIYTCRTQLSLFWMIPFSEVIIISASVVNKFLSGHTFSTSETIFVKKGNENPNRRAKSSFNRYERKNSFRRSKSSKKIRNATKRIRSNGGKPNDLGLQHRFQNWLFYF